MGVRRFAALAVAAVLATGLAACGDDGGDDGGDAALEDVEGSSDEAEAEGDASEEESDDESSDDANLGALGSEECQEVFAALSGFGSAFSSGEGELSFGDFADAFEELADQAPEIEDDLNTLADAYREFDEALGGDVDFSDPDLFQSEEFLEASEAFQSEDVTEASNNVSAFFEDACGSTG